MSLAKVQTMLNRNAIKLMLRGVREIAAKHPRPIVGTIILTDICNLACEHCATYGLRKEMYSYRDISREMHTLYRAGVRVLFFSGGETMLWRDGDKTVRDLVNEARQIGFPLVNFVTNGTLDFDTPAADLILLSIDGVRETHDRIRGVTFDRIMANVAQAKGSNICLYMAINALNYTEVKQVADIARNTPNIRSISFNFHTPYPGTEHIAMTREQNLETGAAIKELIRAGYPVFNLASGIDAYLRGDWKRPCDQCVVSEDKVSTACGRCQLIPGLCENCGYLFAVEYSLLFNGDPVAIAEMVRTYPRYA